MNKKKVMIAAIVLALVLSIGGVLAYFSDSDTATNTFTVGNVGIEVSEPTWDSTGSTDAATVLPNQLIDKDPYIKNTGDNAAYVFMKVSIPTATVVVENDNGGPASPTSSSQALFELYNSTPAAGVNSGWQLVSGPTTVGSNVEYVYSYSSGGTMTSLASGATTSTPLFSKIKFANVQENWGVEGTSYNVEVTGYAIQTANLTTNNYTTNTDVLCVLNANAIHPATP